MVESDDRLRGFDSLGGGVADLSVAFDTNAAVSSTPSTLDVAGQVLWPNSNTVDATASNVELGWRPTCP